MTDHKENNLYSPMKNTFSAAQVAAYQVGV